ncbi:MAG: hypothetical protein QM777_24045 [Pseudorhodoferax sp.]
MSGYKVLGDAAAEVVRPAPFDDVHLSLLCSTHREQIAKSADFSFKINNLGVLAEQAGFEPAVGY